MSVPDAVQNGSAPRAWIRAGSSGNNSGGLNRFQSRLNFTCALIALDWFLDQAALNDGPQPGGDGRPKRFRDFAHDRRADLEACTSFKWQASTSCFVEHNSKRPQITAIVCGLPAQDFGRHVRQGAAYAGGVVQGRKGEGRALKDAASHLFRQSEIEDLHQTIRGNNDVRRLQISV